MKLHKIVNSLKCKVFITFNAIFCLNIAQDNNQLILNAEKYIKTKPAILHMTSSQVRQNYIAIQQKWLGKTNASNNESIVNSNPLFSNMEDNIVTPGYSIIFKRILYTVSVNNEKQQVSGLLILPATNTPKGIVLFFHSTIIGKLNVPSLSFNEYKSQILAATFALHGYIVVAPDYIGLGNNFMQVHPYILYPKLNVYDAKNMLLTINKQLRQEHNRYSLPKLIPLFVSGYSEGASYALWFSRIYQENSRFLSDIKQAGLQLKLTVPIEGAYNLTRVMFPFLLTNQVGQQINQFNINSTLWGTLLKPSFLVSILTSYSAYSHKPLELLLSPDFSTLQCTKLPDLLCKNNDETQLNLATLPLSPAKTFSIALKYFFAAYFKKANGETYSLFSNSVLPLIAPNLKNDKELLRIAKEADIVSWYSRYPITFISLSRDSLVPEQNTTDAYTGLIASGSKQIKYIKIDNHLLKTKFFFTIPIDHISFELYALLIAIKQFDQTLVSKTQ